MPYLPDYVTFLSKPAKTITAMLDVKLVKDEPINDNLSLEEQLGDTAIRVKATKA